MMKNESSKVLASLNKQLESITNDSKARSDIFYKKGIQFCESNAILDAIEAFGYSIVNYPEISKPYIALMECYEKMSNTQMALSFCDMALSLEKNKIVINELSVRKKYLLIKDISIPNEFTKDAQENYKKLIVAGDMCLARQLPDYVINNGPQSVFASIQPIFNEANAVMANLECVVSNTGKLHNKGERRPYYYRANPIVLDVLTKSGINIVTTANNHSMDYGVDALREQNEMLSACHVAHPGSGRNIEEAAKPSFVSLDGLILGVISVDTQSHKFEAKDTTFGIHTKNSYQKVLLSIAGAIAIASTHADIIVVSPHWGANWEERPSEEIRLLAHKIIDCGADIIAGHSAHILQGIEIYKDKPIVYDMGSILFDRVAENRMKYSALFEFQLNKYGVHKIIIHPVYLKRAKAILAQGKDAKKTQELLIALSEELNNRNIFTWHNGQLIVDLPATNTKNYLKRSPSNFENYNKRKLKRLPIHFLDRKNAALNVNMYKFVGLARPVMLGSSLTLKSILLPKEVRPGRGITVRIEWLVNQPMPGHIDGYILGRNDIDDIVFEYMHPLTEGVYPHSMWLVNDLICHETVVRPPKDLKCGQYKLYFLLKNRRTKKYLFMSDGNGMVARELLLGNISVTKKAIPGVSGLRYKVQEGGIVWH